MHSINSVCKLRMCVTVHMCVYILCVCVHKSVCMRLCMSAHTFYKYMLPWIMFGVQPIYTVNRHIDNR